MELVSCLLLTHLLYDFHWQGPFIAEMKGKSWFLLWVHAMTWALCIWVVLWLFDQATWWHLWMLAVSHFGIDAWKARYTNFDSLGAALWIDQTLHLATMLLCIL